MFAFMALPVVVAVLVVCLRRGGFRAILALRLRQRWLIGLAAAVQFVRLTEPAWAAPILTPLRGAVPVVLIWALVAGFAVVNLRSLPRTARTPMGLFLTGMTLNSLAIAANGGMPFSTTAARWAGLTETQIETYVVGHPPLTGESRLAPLADVLPVPGLHAVASVGDLLIFAGLPWLLAVIMLRGARTPAAPDPART